MWTPYDIEVMLHHHCSSAPFPRKGAPAYAPCVDRLLSAGLLEYEDGIAKSTELGAALIKLWCDQPIPVAKYVDPRFEGRSP